MNLVTHLFRKDILRSRWLLVGWVLLLILQGVLISSSANPGDQIAQMAYGMINVAVPVFQALLLMIIVPFVVQDEPLVGTTAFWLTRPLSRGTLLRAKTLYAAAVLVLPALLVEVIVLAANGITAHEIALAVPEILLGKFQLIVIIAILAALTPSFGRYAIVGASGVIVWWITAIAIQWWRLYRHPDLFVPESATISLAKSASVVSGVAAILVFAAIIAYQYLTSRTRNAAIAGCLGLAAVIAVQTQWKWDFLAHPVSKILPAQFDVSAVKIALGSHISVRDVSEMRDVGPARKEIEARIEISGVPARYALQVKHVQPELKLSQGVALDVHVSPRNIMYMPANLYKEALVAGLGGTPVLNVEDLPEETTLFVIDAASYSKYYNEPLNLTDEIEFLVSQYDITAEMPLVKGARFDHGSRHSIITEVLHEPSGVSVVLRERETNLLFDRHNRSGGGLPDFVTGGRHVYVLRNKKRNEAMLQKLDNTNFIGQMYGQSRLVNQAVRISFGPGQNFREHAFDLTPEWLADAELIRLDLTPVFQFSKPLVVEGFKMNNTQP
jgi:hypothetical protein